MTTDEDIRARFWKALKADMTVMLGMDGVPPRPMTAQVDDGDHTEDGHHGPIWFFTAKSTELGEALGTTAPAAFAFASKGHDIFATVQGRLTPDTDRAVVDRLWSPFVAAWYEGGKDDPDLLLLRFDPVRAEIWLNGNSLVAGLKMLLGADPKEEYRDHKTEGPLA